MIKIIVSGLINFVLQIGRRPLRGHSEFAQKIFNIFHKIKELYSSIISWKYALQADSFRCKRSEE